MNLKDDEVVCFYLILQERLVKAKDYGKEYGLNKRLTSFLMKHDFMYQPRLRKSINKAIENGDLKPGDDLSSFLKDNNIDLKSVSFKERLSDIIRNESVDIELVTEEARYSSTNKYPVFIVLMHSGTTLANAIKAFTKDEFSHACISFNSKLDPLYSFGNKKVNVIDPGFVIQNSKSDFYKKHKAYYNVFVMYADKDSYKKMKERLQYFIDNKDDLKYDLASLFKIANGKPSEESKKYFCSKFCMNVIGAGRELEKVPSLWKPEDIKGLDDISLVDKGVDFSLYDFRETEKNLEKIKKQSVISSTQKESTLTTEERKDIPNSDFGIPVLKKYPMPDEEHVRSAIRFFNYVDEEYEELLAENIRKKIKEFNMEVNVGKKNRLSKYL